MSPKFVVLLLAMPGLAHAVICKTVDADGAVTYTDVPLEQCQEKVKLRGLSGYTPRPIPQSATEADSAAPEQQAFSGYQSIQIMQPEAEGTVRSNEGKVPVAVSLEPDLQPGHRLLVYLDGKLVSDGFDGTVIELNGVERGTHVLRAVVKDGGGSELIDSAEVSFTLRKTGLFDGGPRPTPRAR